jgi:hypothetical protein
LSFVCVYVCLLMKRGMIVLSWICCELERKGIEVPFFFLKWYI